MPTDVAIGVDIGGTKVALALVTLDGEVLARQRMATHSDQGTDDLIARIAQVVRDWAMPDSVRLVGLGVGCPGYVDAVTGRVRLAVNLGWRDVLLASRLADLLGLPVWADNDVRALAAGEQAYGAGQGYEDILYVALGTGLGMAACSGGRWLHGAGPAALELGHFSPTGQGRLCVCGRAGCVEAYASGTGLLAGWRTHRAAFPTSELAQAETADVPQVIAAMQAGDALAQLLRDELVAHLVQAVRWACAVLNPALVVLGGGLGLALAHLIQEDIANELADSAHLEASLGPRLALAGMNETAVGAATLVWRNRDLASS